MTRQEAVATLVGLTDWLSDQLSIKESEALTEQAKTALLTLGVTPEELDQTTT